MTLRDHQDRGSIPTAPLGRTGPFVSRLRDNLGAATLDLTPDDVADQLGTDRSA